MTPFRYRAYIRPQLRSIRAEYYQLINRVRPQGEHFIEMKAQGEQIASNWKQLKTSCEDLTEICRPMIGRIYQQVERLEMQILSQSSQSISQLDLNNDLEETFRLLKIYDQMTQGTYQILHHLEEMQMLLESPYLREQAIFREADHQFQKLFTYTDIIHTKMISNEYKMLFDLLWRNFIRPIERHILHSDDKRYLMRNLERLNFSLNEFRMQMISGRFEMSEQDLRLIQTIHRRWNTVLRVLIRDIE